MTNIHTMRKLCPDEELRKMYEVDMLTTAEIADYFQCSNGKVAKDLKRIGIKLRKASRRFPLTGEAHPNWKGDKASYSAFHYRVISLRGRPQKCEQCGSTKGQMEWSNITGKYGDVNDYIRLCTGCHRKVDFNRRIQSKKMTSLHGSNDGKFRHAHRAILTEDQVLEAKSLRQEGWMWNELGNKYGVCGNAIRLAVIGKNWKHLIEK